MSAFEIERAVAEDEDDPASQEGHRTPASIGVPPGMTSTHASFDRDVVEVLKSGGRAYQTRMNAVLRRHMEAQRAGKPAG